MMKRFEKVVKASWEGKTLGSFLMYEMKLSKRMLRRLKAVSDGITVNGEHKTVRYLLKRNDKVSIASHLEKEMSYQAEEIDISVLYEDEDYFIVDKAPYMIMYPRYRGETGSLANFSRSYLEKKNEKGGFFPLSRLDKGTSGLVLLAKSNLAASKMNGVKFKKAYHALVSGKLLEGGILENYLKEAPYSTLREGPLFTVGKTGKWARLSYQSLFYDEDENKSGLWVLLETGRRHQIRVQLSHLGHTIVGDKRYGNNDFSYDRPLLHAAYLSFISPISGREISVFNPLHHYHEADNIARWEKFFEEGRLL